jgi:hypothetical protein
MGRGLRNRDLEADVVGAVQAAQGTMMTGALGPLGQLLQEHRV